MTTFRTWTLIAALALSACSMKDEASKPSPTAGPCQKVGDNCEFSPGKLGTCIQKMGCTSADGCFVCQSQH